MPMQNEEEPSTVSTPESDVERDRWRESITTWQAETNERLDRGNKRLDDLDRGNLHIIKRLDSQDRQLDTVIQLSQNMQSAGRFFNRIFGFFAMIGRGIHAAAKFLWPIVALGALVWGVLYAWIHGGKPPSVG